MNTVKIRTLMSLPAVGGRKAKRRNVVFEAKPQEARDLVRLGQAEYVGKKDADAHATQVDAK